MLQHNQGNDENVCRFILKGIASDEQGNTMKDEKSTNMSFMTLVQQLAQIHDLQMQRQEQLHDLQIQRQEQLHDAQMNDTKMQRQEQIHDAQMQRQVQIHERQLNLLTQSLEMQTKLLESAKEEHLCEKRDWSRQMDNMAVQLQEQSRLIDEHDAMAAEQSAQKSKVAQSMTGPASPALDNSPSHGHGSDNVNVWSLWMQQASKDEGVARSKGVEAEAVTLQEPALAWHPRQAYPHKDLPLGDFEPRTREALLLKRYQPALRGEIASLKQEQSLSDYVNRFMELAMDLDNETEDAMLYSFIHGLAPHVKETVGSACPSTLIEAIELAQRCDSSPGGRKSPVSLQKWSKQRCPSEGVDKKTRPPSYETSQSTSSSKTCSFCKKTGHLVADCWKKTARGGSRTNS